MVFARHQLSRVALSPWGGVSGYMSPPAAGWNTAAAEFAAHAAKDVPDAVGPRHADASFSARGHSAMAVPPSQSIQQGASPALWPRHHTVTGNTPPCLYDIATPGVTLYRSISVCMAEFGMLTIGFTCRNVAAIRLASHSALLPLRGSSFQRRRCMLVDKDRKAVGVYRRPSRQWLFTAVAPSRTFSLPMPISLSSPWYPARECPPAGGHDETPPAIGNTATIGG